MWINGLWCGCTLSLFGQTQEALKPYIADSWQRQMAAAAVVEEKFGEQNFRVLSELRFVAKIRVSILDFCRVCRFFNEIWCEIGF